MPKCTIYNKFYFVNHVKTFVIELSMIGINYCICLYDLTKGIFPLCLDIKKTKDYSNALQLITIMQNKHGLDKLTYTVE